MEFPDWAPQRLLEEIGSIEREIKMLEGADSAQECFSCGHTDDEIVTEYLKDKKEKLAAFYRLATHHYMRDVWKSIAGWQLSPRVTPRDANAIDSAVASIGLLLDHFRGALESSETFAKKKRKFTSVATRLAELADDLQQDPIMRQMLRVFVPTFIGMKVLDHRATQGEKIRPHDAHYPENLIWSDIREAPNDDSGEPYQYSWKEIPIAHRMKHWAMQGQELYLPDLMHELARWMEKEAEIQPRIKQPWRGDQERRPYLIRGISEWSFYFFGQPLDDTVALIVSAILDLDPVLGRDDVRPYRNGDPGSETKKSS